MSIDGASPAVSSGLRWHTYPGCPPPPADRAGLLRSVCIDLLSADTSQCLPRRAAPRRAVRGRQMVEVNCLPPLRPARQAPQQQVQGRKMCAPGEVRRRRRLRLRACSRVTQPGARLYIAVVKAWERHAGSGPPTTHFLGQIDRRAPPSNPVAQGPRFSTFE